MRSDIPLDDGTVYLLPFCNVHTIQLRVRCWLRSKAVIYPKGYGQFTIATNEQIAHSQYSLRRNFFPTARLAWATAPFSLPNLSFSSWLDLSACKSIPASKKPSVRIQNSQSLTSRDKKKKRVTEVPVM